MTELSRRLLSMVLLMVLLMVLSMVVLMVVKWVSHCTVLGDKLGCTELTEGTELGALEGGFDGLIEGRNIKSNMPFSCLKQSIGSSEGTVDVSMAWNWTSHWVNVIRDTLGSAANHRGYSLDLWRVALMVCLAAMYHWTRYFAKHAAWLLEVSIGLPEGIVNDTVNGWKVGLRWGTFHSDNLGFAEQVEGWGLAI